MYVCTCVRLLIRTHTRSLHMGYSSDPRTPGRDESDWLLLLLRDTVIRYPCLRVYVVQIDVDLMSRCLIFCRNRTDDLGIDRPVLWPTKLVLHRFGYSLEHIKLTSPKTPGVQNLGIYVLMYNYKLHMYLYMLGLGGEMKSRRTSFSLSTHVFFQTFEKKSKRCDCNSKTLNSDKFNLHRPSILDYFLKQSRKSSVNVTVIRCNAPDDSFVQEGPGPSLSKEGEGIFWQDIPSVLLVFLNWYCYWTDIGESLHGFVFSIMFKVCCKDWVTVLWSGSNHAAHFFLTVFTFAKFFATHLLFDSTTKRLQHN